MKLGRLAKTLAEDVNVKRRAKGLLPRAVGCMKRLKVLIYLEFFLCQVYIFTS